MNIKNIIITVLFVAVLVPVTQAGAFKGSLDILTTQTMDGNNPATGQPWATGDEYRFAFFTSVKIDATSSDINTYNAWVQGLADATTVYNIGADEGVTWKAIGSTNTVDARDNTSTNPSVDGTGCAIYLLDGSTVVANDNADLWDGSIQNIINITEQGTISTHWPFTGSYLDGTKSSDHGASFSALGGGGDVGQGNSASATEWIWRTWTGAPDTSQLQMYALSEPLTVVISDTDLPTVEIDTPDMITWSGEPVALDATVTNNDTSVPQGELTYTWTADPDFISGELEVTINNADQEDAEVIVDKLVLTDDATTITLTLSVLLEGKSVAITDSITVDVYDDGCQAALDLGLATIDPGDFDGNCKINLDDIASMATEWLEDYSLDFPAEKP